MDLFTQTREQICVFERKLNDSIENTQTLFDNFITQVNSTSQLTHVSNSLDKLYLDNIPDYKAFCNTIAAADFTVPVDSFWYDMNKCEWITKPITKLSTGKKFGEYNIEITLFNENWIDIIQYAERQKFESLIKFNIIRQSGKHFGVRRCNCILKLCYCGNYIAMENKGYYNIKLIIDTNYNIYLPDYKLYLVNNYQQIPYDALYNNRIGITPNITLSLNSSCPSDKAIWDNVNAFIMTTASPASFTTSLDIRSKFNDGTLFKKVNQHLNYDENVKTNYWLYFYRHHNI